MTARPSLRKLGLLAVLLQAASWLAPADEGMWLFNNPPVSVLKSRYQFEPPPAWLEHLQKSSVRFNNGGSGSFVSGDGLVFTNHHVAADCLQKLSTAQRDYLNTGFSAGGHSEEPACPDLELNVLMSIEDVTGRVNAAVQPGAGPEETAKARRAAINTIEKESLDKTGLRSDVVTLYDGGQYHLYRYKKYTDVRLVFAPEKAIAFFGGDPDNFEYPRYDLDITFFRAYENGKPAKVEHFLKWNSQGARDGGLVFVSGHPGRTDRLDTVNDLEFLRDMVNPLSLNVIRRREVMLRTFSERSLENARRAQDDLFSYQNSRKARLGMLAGLQNPSLMEKKRAEQNALRDAVRKSDRLERSYGDAWDQVAAANKVQSEIHQQHYLWERGQAFNSQLFAIARDLVRMTEEIRKPNAERLREYSEAALSSLKQELFSEAPIYADLETAKLADSLSLMMEMAGADDPLVKQVLAGKSPQERAAELVEGTQLTDVAVREKLAAGGQEAIQESGDPMIRLARLVDPVARKLRSTMEQKVDEPKRQAYAKLAGARFAVYGTGVYPDATFTLRLSFGQVKGYEERGRQINWSTNLGGAYTHAAEHQNREPYRLPESWVRNKNRLDLSTPFNFVSTADVIGGNSGSPVVNRAGEVVGIIFDGNVYSLVLDFAYTDERARAVSVHSAGITEALRKIYDARRVLSELGVGQ
jgi:Peptidase S46